MLKGVGLNAFAIAYCILVLWVVGTAALLADYFHRRWFYQQLAENLAATNKGELPGSYHAGHTFQRWKTAF